MIFSICSFQIVFLSITEKPAFLFYLFMHQPPSIPEDKYLLVGPDRDLAFSSSGPDSRLPHRHVLEKFPRSQHQPSLIIPSRLTLAVHGKPVKHWNYREANWSHCISLINKLARKLPSLDSSDVNQAYRSFVLPPPILQQKIYSTRSS